MSTESTIPQPPANGNLENATRRLVRPVAPRNPQEVYDYTCPECGSPTLVHWMHVGGRGKYPHLVCPNHEGGCQTYLVCRLDPDHYNAYLDWLIKMDMAKVSIRGTEDEPPPTATEEQRLRVRCLDLEAALLSARKQIQFLTLKRILGHGITSQELMEIATAIGEAFNQEVQ